MSAFPTASQDGIHNFRQATQAIRLNYSLSTMLTEKLIQTERQLARFLIIHLINQGKGVLILIGKAY